MKIKFGLFLSGLILFINGFAQQGEPPELLFKEDWNQLPPFDVMTPYSLTQKDVMNPDLIQTLYGPGQDSIKKRHHGTDKDAYYIYTGFCRSAWALALSHKSFYIDLSGDAVIRCRVRNSGMPIDNPEFHYGKHWLNLADKIGFTDLMNGGLSDACSRVDWIEVYANPVKR
jgi:hypothetical protein